MSEANKCTEGGFLVVIDECFVDSGQCSSVPMNQTVNAI